MAITREIALDRVEILEDGIIQVRYAIYFNEDGARISDPKYQREVYPPTTDITAIKTNKIAAIAQVVWTQNVIDAYKAKMASIAVQAKL